MSLRVDEDKSASAVATPDQRHAIGFGADAGIYASYRPEYPDEIFDKLSSALECPPGRVIELGAGSGQATRELARRFSHVTAVEPDGRLLDLMSAPDNVSLLNMPAEEADFSSASVDAVVAASSFHWMDQTEMCGRIAAWLKPGGVFFPFLFGPFQVKGPDAARDVFKRHSADWGPFRKQGLGGNVNYAAAIKASGAFEIFELVDLEFVRSVRPIEAAGILSTISYARAYAQEFGGAQVYLARLADELAEASDAIDMRAPLGGVIARRIA